jgi:hypothetical protein
MFLPRFTFCSDTPGYLIAADIAVLMVESPGALAKKHTRMHKIDLRAHADKRLPIGWLLLVLAAFCIWYGIRAPGVGWVVFGACVAFFGLLAVGERHFIVIDAESGFLTRMRGVVVVVPRASLAIADIRHIELRSYTLRRNRKDSGTERYPVWVCGSTGGKLAEYGDEWYARAVSESVSAALRVPLHNVVYGRHSVRRSDELDLQLAARWQKSGSIKTRPAPSEDSRIEIEELETETRVRFPADVTALKILIPLTLLFVIGAVLAYRVSDEVRTDFMFYLFAGAFIGMWCLVSLAFSGRSRLIFTDRTVSFRQGHAPLEHSIELQKIEEMICAPDAIYLVGDEAKLAIVWPVLGGDRIFLRSFLQFEIARRCKSDAEVQHT